MLDTIAHATAARAFLLLFLLTPARSRPPQSSLASGFRLQASDLSPRTRPTRHMYPVCAALPGFRVECNCLQLRSGLGTRISELGALSLFSPRLSPMAASVLHVLSGALALYLPLCLFAFAIASGVLSLIDRRRSSPLHCVDLSDAGRLS